MDCAPVFWASLFSKMTTSSSRRLWTSLIHVLPPRFKLTAHDCFRGAVVGVRDAVLACISTVVAMEAHPVAAVGLEPPLTFRPILEIVGVDHGRRRVDQIEIPQSSPVNGLRHAFQPKVPDLRQRLVRRNRSQHPQLLQG